LTDNSILNVQSVKDAKADLDAKKKALNDLNKELDDAKKLATADKITAAFKSADTEINNLQTAQTAFIQAYEEEAKKKSAEIKKVEGEQKKITDALAALATATNALTDNSILNIPSVKDTKENLDTKKKALNDLNKELDDAKKLATAADINAAFKSADNEINNLQTAQKAFTQAYEAEKTRIETAKQEEAKKKDKAIEKVDAEITKITNALNGLATATNALTDNSIINVQSVKDAKAELDAKKKGS
jgi:DNA repair exonuclease SbcCD ATPase subunit